MLYIYYERELSLRTTTVYTGYQTKMATDLLVFIDSHQSSHCSSRCSYSRNYFSSDTFRLEAVCWLNMIHRGTEVRRRRNIINMSVCIVILLELCRSHVTSSFNKVEINRIKNILKKEEVHFVYPSCPYFYSYTDHFPEHC